MDNIKPIMLAIVGFVIALAMTFMVFGDILKVNENDVVKTATESGLNLLDGLMANGLVTVIVILLVAVFIVTLIFQLIKSAGGSKGGTL